MISGGECKSGDLDTALAHFIAAQAAMLSALPAGPLERRLARKFNKLPATATAPATPAAPAAIAALARPRARRRAAAYDSIT